jgi:hypothetical protein
MVLQNLEIQYWRVENLIPYARNPRKNDAAVDRMVAAIREFGFAIPLLVRGSGEIVDGHLRLKAAKKLNMTEVPALSCDAWSEAQVKAFRLQVNRSVTWAEWDEELVALELEELKDMDFDLGLTGFDPVEIDHFLLDEAEEQSAGCRAGGSSDIGRTDWRPVGVRRASHHMWRFDQRGSGFPPAWRAPTAVNGDGSSVRNQT